MYIYWYIYRFRHIGLDEDTAQLTQRSSREIYGLVPAQWSMDLYARE